MSYKIKATIQDIAVKHGVILGKDDPILILQTMNERLIEENRQAQAAMLVQFREEMESISSQWKDDTKEKAEKILNSALANTKEVMAKLLQEFTTESVQIMKKMISESLIESHHLAQQTQKFSRLTLFSSALVLTVSGLLLLSVFTF